MTHLHFASIPVLGEPSQEAELNRFLASHRVLSVDRQLVQAGAASVWAICVTYTDGDPAAATKTENKARTVDYREVLSPQEFAVFAKLRVLRKTLAEQEGVPPYALFTNEHLAAMVQNKVRTTEELGRIDGVGRTRIEKYAHAFLNLLSTCDLAPSAGEGKRET